MTKVATHRLSSPFGSDEASEKATCECGRKATYWTQAENGERLESPVVYHCQAHRSKARKLVKELARAFVFCIKAITGGKQ